MQPLHAPLESGKSIDRLRPPRLNGEERNQSDPTVSLMGNAGHPGDGDT